MAVEPAIHHSSTLRVFRMLCRYERSDSLEAQTFWPKRPTFLI
jgi:hypothetical protein